MYTHLGSRELITKDVYLSVDVEFPIDIPSVLVRNKRMFTASYK